MFSHRCIWFLVVSKFLSKSPLTRITVHELTRVDSRSSELNMSDYELGGIPFMYFVFQCQKSVTHSVWSNYEQNGTEQHMDKVSNDPKLKIKIEK